MDSDDEEEVKKFTIEEEIKDDNNLEKDTTNIEAPREKLKPIPLS